jgi:hypothetical protein
MVAIREKPSEKSEMTNQILFGDLFFVNETMGEWLLISTVDDSYFGWANSLQLHLFSEEEFRKYTEVKRTYSLIDSILSTSLDKTTSVRYTMGSRLPFYENETFKIDNKIYSHKGQYIDSTSDNKLIDIAKIYLGSPYLWGGRSIFGIDCSGLVQMSFKLKGKFLPRDASMQVKLGNTINFIEEAQENDLAFFENEDSQITHVGILLDNKRIIHSSGKVKIDDIDHNGIFDKSKNKYTHKLRIIKRIE